jgi:hypothetical protein
MSRSDGPCGCCDEYRQSFPKQCNDLLDVKNYEETPLVANPVHAYSHLSGIDENGEE